MEPVQFEKIEQVIVDIINKLCKKCNINETVNGDFCPGTYIKSHVLVSIIPEIEIKTGISIPLECYIFNNKENNPHSIKNAVNKLLIEIQ